MGNWDEEIDRLYTGPLEGFTAARNELAARLKEAGDERAAAEVGTFRKPTVVAWTVNQLVHRHPDDIESLLQIRDRLAGDTRSATADRRRLLNRLARRAEDILQEAGHGASADTVRRISTTLLAGSTGTEEEAFRAGRLPRELEPGGLEGAFGMDLPAEEAPTETHAGRSHERARRLGEEAAAAEREAQRLGREAEVARAEAQRAEKAADRAEKRAADAADRAEAVRRRADEALEDLG